MIPTYERKACVILFIAKQDLWLAFNILLAKNRIQAFQVFLLFLIFDIFEQPP